jgi:DNA-binding CsgD family transcriptional regulator
MVAREGINVRDLHKLVEIISGRRTDLPEAGLPWSLMSDLRDLIPSDWVVFCGFPHKLHAPTWFLQQTSPDDADDEAYWQHKQDCPPLCYPERGGDLRQVIRYSDFYSPRQWHNSGIYRDYFRVAGVEHALVLFFPVPGWSPREATLRLAFFRASGPDFSERERGLLALLRPHLREAYLDAERGRHRTPHLTPRQWDLLRLIAAGYTNGQIARRLDVSEGTVRKHLENIYAKLQVTSRAAAITCAFRSGPPGEPQDLVLTSPSGNGMNARPASPMAPVCVQSPT